MVSTQMKALERQEKEQQLKVCFTQLINAGSIDVEEVFWSKENIIMETVVAATPNNDGIVDAGENAWGYVRGLSTSSRTNVPIIFDSSNTIGLFDTAVWDGKAVVAKLDGSVESMKIAYTGKPIKDDGSSKTKAIEEKRGTDKVDIFSSTALRNRC